MADADIGIGRLLRRSLPAEGFQVELVYSGQAVLDRIGHDRPDLIVLGTELPDMATLGLVGRMSSISGPPLLVLLEAGDTNLVRMLDAGASDCMRKPFAVSELAARLRKILRQHMRSRGVPTSIVTAALELDCVLWRATVCGAQVRLSVKEHAALQALVENAGYVVSYSDLSMKLWGFSKPFLAERTSSVMLGLRRKLALTADGPVRLQIVSQIGYRLVVPSTIPVHNDRDQPG